MSDGAWRLHTHALMWAIGRTDGAIPDSILPTLLAIDAARAAAELVSAGLWERASGGWQIVDWDATQSTVEQIEHNRKLTRERVRRHREATLS